MNTSSPSAVPPPAWQPERHLHSGDRIWFLTDIERYTSSYYAWSVPQELFRAGVYDLATGKIGLVVFGRDIAFAFMKIRLPPPPWKQPTSFGIELHREGHDDDEEKGRYLVQARLVPLEPDALQNRRGRPRLPPFGAGHHRRILLPAVLPAYVVALRVGLGLGWMFVVAAELIEHLGGPWLSPARWPATRQAGTNSRHHRGLCHSRQDLQLRADRNRRRAVVALAGCL